MADEVVINGVASDEQTGESFSDLDQRGDNDARVVDLSRKIESLEHEKLRLVHENAETKERIKRLTAEIEELRYEEASTKEKLGEMEKEIERSEDAKKALCWKRSSHPTSVPDGLDMSLIKLISLSFN